MDGLGCSIMGIAVPLFHGPSTVGCPQLNSFSCWSLFAGLMLGCMGRGFPVYWMIPVLYASLSCGMLSIAVANQVVAHAEQVFPRVKEKCAAKRWLANEDVISLEEMIGHLRRLKENMGFIDSRVTAIQAGLDSWQAEQINRRLYYLSFLSMIFLPLSVITGVFGMNVGGVPWTTQRDPFVKDGFWNVMLLCGALLLFLVVCFAFRALYTRISAWTLRKHRAFRRSASINRKSFLGRPNLSNGEHVHGHYVRI